MGDAGEVAGTAATSRTKAPRFALPAPRRGPDVRPAGPAQQATAVERISVLVQASDPISHAGVVAQLGGTSEVRIVPDSDAGTEQVCVVVVEEFDDSAVGMLRAVARHDCWRAVLVASRIDDLSLVRAVEAGVVGMVLRSQATAHNLLCVIRGAARGDGAVPPDLLGRLLAQVSRMQRQVAAPAALSRGVLAQRELDVLRLVADGYDTAEIARRLAYSERTVKSVLHDITSRMNLRNRSQAVAYAIRQGLI